MSGVASSSSPLRRSPRRPLSNAGPSALTSSPASDASPRRRTRDAADASPGSAVTPTRRATKAQQRELLLNSPQHSAQKRARRGEAVTGKERAGASAAEASSSLGNGHRASTSNSVITSNSPVRRSREERRIAEAQERAELEEELRSLQDEIGTLTTDYRRVQQQRRRQRRAERNGYTEEEEMNAPDGIGDETEDSLEGLLRGMKAASNGAAADAELEVSGAHDASEIAALEAMLRDMDDKDLASLLTNGGSLPANLASLLPTSNVLPTVLPPARSAGIEGTGSGIQLDDEEKRLAQAHTDASVANEANKALRARLERSDELTEALSSFCSIDLTSIESAPLVRAKENTKRLLRRTSMRATLPGNLGQLVVDMEVEEDESTKETPQIVGLDVEVGDPVFAAIGAQQISHFVDKVNLPALLLAIRTLIPLARLRFHFLASIAKLFSELAREHVDQLAARDVDLVRRANKRSSRHPKLPSLAALIDPEVLGSLSLRGDRGIQLDVVFGIEFNQWGHARPHLSLKPIAPPQARLSREARHMLDALPRQFAHLCAHCPAPFDARTALIATIEAFFDL